MGLYRGDCIGIFATLPDNSIDTCITDPPAGISFMNKAWDSDRGGRDQWIEWLSSVLREVYRVMKPGGSLLVWSIPRTSHWTGAAVENAGFRIIDVVQHIFGSGFPKSLDISKAIDKAAGAEREKTTPRGPIGVNKTRVEQGYRPNEVAQSWSDAGPATPLAATWDGWGTALKPAAEFWWLAYKPRDGTYAENAEKWGVAGLWIDGGRIEAASGDYNHPGNLERRPMARNSFKAAITGDTKVTQAPPNAAGRWPANVILDEQFDTVLVLRYNIPDDIKQVIREYFNDYELPGVRQRIQDLPKQGESWQGTILQSSMLQLGVEGKNAGQKSPDVWQEAPPRLDSQDGESGAGESDIYDRRELPGLEGRQALCTGLRDDSREYPARTRATSVSINGDEIEREVYSRTPSCDGAVLGASTDEHGKSASSKWGKRRQQDRESGVVWQQGAQNETCRTDARVGEVEARERTLEVLDCDIPEQWLKYFEPTGYIVRSPRCAAALLDEQSGVSTSRSRIGKRSGKRKGILGEFAGQDEVIMGHSDSGGLSRFFYCAKASRSERNAGLEGMEAVPCGMMEDDNYPIKTGSGNLRDTKRQNHHPTIKPLSLMRYLCRLTNTPTGGVVLDPFMGSGTTGMAAIMEGRSFIGIELDPEYFKIAQARIQYAVDESQKPRQAEMEM